MLMATENPAPNNCVAATTSDDFVYVCVFDVKSYEIGDERTSGKGISLLDNNFTFFRLLSSAVAFPFR